MMAMPTPNQLKSGGGMGLQRAQSYLRALIIRCYYMNDYSIVTSVVKIELGAAW